METPLRLGGLGFGATEVAALMACVIPATVAALNWPAGSLLRKGPKLAYMQTVVAVQAVSMLVFPVLA